MKTVHFLISVLFTFTITAQHEDVWMTQATGLETGRAIKDISIVDFDVVWALAFDSLDEENNIQEFTRTTNAETWTAGVIDVGSPNSGIAMINGVNATTAWVVVYPHTAGDNKGIYKTTDTGVTWVRSEAVFNADNSFPNVIHFFDENNGFAQGDPIDGYFELYTTTDGGDNWIRVPEENIPAPETGEYGRTGRIEAIGDSIWWITNRARIFRSRDLGTNFEVLPSPLCDFDGLCDIQGLSFATENIGYLIFDNLLYKTNNGGESWNIVFPSGTFFTGDIAAIPYYSSLITVGSSGVTGSSYSVDNSTSFTTICDDSHYGIEMLNTDIGWSGGVSASTTEGGIYKFDSILWTICGEAPVGIGIEDLIVFEFSASPNPVIDQLQLAAKENITSIHIQNIYGQEVYKNNNSSLSHVIDMTDFSSGTYLLTVTIKNTTGTMKIIK